MEFVLEDQVQTPIVNDVEVLNGGAFRDIVIKSRVQPLLDATSASELLDVLDTARESFKTIGADASFVVAPGVAPATLPGVLSTRTIVDLTNVLPSQAVELSTRAANRLSALGGQWNLYNHLGLGELLQICGTAQPEPYTLAAGSASLTLPMPLGRGALRLKSFFHNENRVWSSFSMASHGIAAELRVPWVGGLLFRTGVRAVARNVHSISEGASDVVRAAAGQSSLLVALRAKLEHAGLFHDAKVTVEAAGNPGDEQHIKATGAFNWLTSLTPNDELVARFSGRAGYLHSKDDKVRLCDNFVIGGPDSLLGFAKGSVGPRDGSDFVGGQAFYTSRAALLAKLPFQPLSPLRLTALVDAGVLKMHSSPTLQGNIRDLANAPATLSAAAGLTYQMPSANFDVLYVIPVRGAESDLKEPGLFVGAALNLA